MPKPPRFFLDTNILVYAFDDRFPSKARRAQALVQKGIETGLGVISFQVVQEFLNAALKKFAAPMHFSEADGCITTVLQPMLGVQSSIALYYEALRIHNHFSLSWYDSLIVAAALQAKCAILYSEDMQNGMRIESLQIRNPFVE